MTEKQVHTLLAIVRDWIDEAVNYYPECGPTVPSKTDVLRAVQDVLAADTPGACCESYRKAHPIVDSTEGATCGYCGTVY